MPSFDTLNNTIKATSYLERERTAKQIFEILEDVTKDIPESEWNKIPTWASKFPDEHATQIAQFIATAIFKELEEMFLSYYSDEQFDPNDPKHSWFWDELQDLKNKYVGVQTPSDNSDSSKDASLIEQTGETTEEPVKGASKEAPTLNKKGDE